MNNSYKIKRMVGIASLAAIAAVLQFVSQFIMLGPFNITLALTPLVVGAILYGPFGGTILGLVIAVVILISGQASAFFAINPIATVFVVLLKTSLAGFVSGIAFKSLKNKNPLLGTIIASLVAPITNTGVFALGCMSVLYDALSSFAGEQNTIYYLFIIMIGLNFIVEFLINSLLSPVLYRLVKIFVHKLHINAYFNIEEKNKEISNDNN